MEEIKQITDQDFENEIKQGLVLVDFYADWCGPCKMLAPVLQEVNGQIAGKAKIIKIDIDVNQEAPKKYGVTALPTMILFKDGAVVDQLVGLKDAPTLVSLIEKHA